MSDNQSFAKSRDTAIDGGLRRHMQSVYNRMTIGVLITAVTSFLVSSSPVLLKILLGGPQAYIVMFAPVVVLWFGFRPDRMSAQKLSLSFFAISILYGISFSAIFLAYTGADIARAFFVASAMFAGLSIYGYTTKRDLTALRTFAVMGIMGVFVASIGAMFFHSPVLQNVIAGVGIIAFAGMTAYKTQALKEMYSPSYGDEMNSRVAWSGALTLYISFIAMFQYILHFMSQR